MNDKEKSHQIQPHSGHHRDPLKRFFSDPFWHPFGSFFDEPFLFPFGENQIMAPHAFPCLDVSENDKELKIEAEIPGYSSDNIDIEIEDDVLTIRGKMEEENEEKDKKYYRKERAYGSFQRAIKLPSYLDTEDTKCESKNGVLTIIIPKKKEAKKRKINVKVK